MCVAFGIMSLLDRQYLPTCQYEMHAIGQYLRLLRRDRFLLSLTILMPVM